MTHIPELTDAEAAVLRCWLLPDDGQREYAVRSTLDRELRSPGSGVVTPNGRRALAAYDAKKRAAIRVEAMRECEAIAQSHVASTGANQHILDREAERIADEIREKIAKEQP